MSGDPRARPQPGPQPGPLPRLLPWLLLLAYTAVVAGLAATAEFRLDWDGSVYLLTAQSLDAGQGYLYQGRPFFLRPPGLSWILTWFMDEGGFHARAATAFLLGTAGTALAALFLLLRGLHGPWIALCVALLTGTSALFSHIFNFMHAEYPFFTLFFLALHLDRLARRRDGAAGLALGTAAGLLLAGAFYLRTAVILVLPGLFLEALARRGARLKGLLPAAVFLLLVLPWFAYTRSAAAQAEVPVDQDLQFDYGTALLRTDPGDPRSPLIAPAAVGERMLGNGRFLAGEMTFSTLHADSALLRALLAALVLAGLLLACHRGSLALESFFLLHLLVVLGYFAYGARLAVPLVPLVYLYAVLALARLVALLGRRCGAAAAATVLAVPFATACAWNLATFSPHFLPEQRASPADRDTRVLAAWLAENTPRDAVLLCNQAPTLGFLSGRRAYTFRFPRTQDLIAKYRPDYVVLDAHAPPAFAAQAAAAARATLVVAAPSGARFTVYRLD